MVIECGAVRALASAAVALFAACSVPACVPGLAGLSSSVGPGKSVCERKPAALALLRIQNLVPPASMTYNTTYIYI